MEIVYFSAKRGGIMRDKADRPDLRVNEPNLSAPTAMACSINSV